MLIDIDKKSLDYIIEALQDLSTYYRDHKLGNNHVEAMASIIAKLAPAAELPVRIKRILESGKMTKAEYRIILDYYVKQAYRSDWFGPYGVDGGGQYYQYVVGRGTAEEVAWKVYLVEEI